MDQKWGAPQKPDNLNLRLDLRWGERQGTAHPKWNSTSVRLRDPVKHAKYSSVGNRVLYRLESFEIAKILEVILKIFP
jgi:hypothetical protein